MRTRQLALTVACAVAIAATAIGASSAVGRGLSTEAESCGAEGNTILEEFEIEEAKGLWRHLPMMLRAPELEADGGRAHVIVFGGEFDTKGLEVVALHGKPSSFDSVVCVVQADGTVNVYTDVSRVGSRWEGK